MRTEDNTPGYPSGARLERALARTSDAPLRRGNRLDMLKNGPETYDDWLAAISGTRRWVHLENYIFGSDEIGHRLADALCQRASEGVTVRVLYDWFGCLNVRRPFWDAMRAAGVEVRVVNPLSLGAPLASPAATTASCSPWTASTPRPAASASPTAGSSATPTPASPTATRPSGSRARPSPTWRGPSPAPGTRRASPCPRKSASKPTALPKTERRPCGPLSRSRGRCGCSGCWSCSRPASRGGSGSPTPTSAWPLGAAGAIFGGLGVIRALRSKLTDASPKLASVRDPDPDHASDQDREG